MGVYTKSNPYWVHFAYGGPKQVILLSLNLQWVTPIMQLVVWSFFLPQTKRKNQQKNGDINLKNIYRHQVIFLFFGNKSLKFLCRKKMGKNHDTKPFQS